MRKYMEVPNGYCCREMDSAKWFQIVEEIVCISHSIATLGNDMNSNFLQ